MKNWVKFSVAGFAFAGAGVGLSLWAGASNWNSEINRLVEQLQKNASSDEMRPISFGDFDQLPAPVAKYFRLVLKDSQPRIRTTRVRHVGEFNMNSRWIPFRSEEYFSVHPPAFIWNAQMQVNPLMSVRVRDGYRDGQGLMVAKMYGLITVVNAAGTNELTAGALQRYLAESPWQPTALLPGENLKWTAMDDQKAMATLTDGATAVSLEFDFNETGEITGVFSPARFKERNGKYEPFPWRGSFSNYAEHSGMRIPMEGEVGWQMPEGLQPYWRGRVIGADYEFSERR
jgi:hypothetical protein